MDKYGVGTDDEHMKTAAREKGSPCPQCGSRNVNYTSGNVPQCPRCGVEPWEARDGKREVKQQR